MNLYIRTADLLSGNVMVISDKNKETVFIASRDKENPFLIQLFNRLNEKVAEIKLKNSFLKIFSIEVNGQEVATINTIPMVEVKYVHIGILNWNIMGNIPMSNYHVKSKHEIVMEVCPMILSLGQPGIQLIINNIDDLECGTLIAIFLNKYIKLPGKPLDDSLSGLHGHRGLSYLNFKNK
ncbi:hypothetical protein [Companilactobacillus ginsenosidimutans]|uniref:Uncharacterized protein n=1 Tax=Companilactobacillus ginsenosidimutans TaxID=1007676 RepID=A0A0H4QIJ9_9LACO|nr:hypothetical protein [Companilactobacillus ginsenosidimutans]AKP68254.1 hypothetical protein ABM34_12375 [Companilactobacillus ginsenosidimutans]